MTYAPETAGTYRALARNANAAQRNTKLEKLRQLVLQSNALLREARKSLETSRKAIERRESWHRADPEALAEALRGLPDLLARSESKTSGSNVSIFGQEGRMQPNEPLTIKPFSSFPSN